MTGSTSAIAHAWKMWFDRCRLWSTLACRAIRSVQMVVFAFLLSHQDNKGNFKGRFGISEEAALFAGTYWESGDHIVCPDLFGLRESGGRDGQYHEADSQGLRGVTPAPEKHEGRHVTLACGSGCAHPVSLAHSKCALATLSIVCLTSSLLTTVRRAARDLVPLPHFPSVELRDGYRALGRSTQRRLQRCHLVDALNSTYSGSVVFPQSRDRCCGAGGAVARGIGRPGALSQLRVARGYTDTPVHLASLDVGALGPAGALTTWWVPVFLARLSSVSVRNCCHRQRRWRLSGVVA